jgi:hypothetical protein
MHYTERSYPGYNDKHYTPPPPVFENTASTQALRTTIYAKIQKAKEDESRASAVQHIENALVDNYNPTLLQALDIQIDTLLR